MIARVLRPDLILTALLAMPSQVWASSPPRKCGGQWAHVAPVTLLDGVVVRNTPEAALKPLDPESVFSIEVACLNPQDSTLNRTSGIPTVSIMTKSGLETSIRRVLATVVDLQDAHFRLYGRYLEHVEPVLLPGRTERLRVEVEGAPDGWLARSGVEGLAVTCVVHVGTVPGVPPGTAPREPTCIAVDSPRVRS